MTGARRTSPTDTGSLVASLALAAVLGGCGVGGIGGPGATPTPAGPQALPAGTYHSSAFQPQLTFTLPGGWWIAVDDPDYLALEPVTSNAVGIHVFRNPSAASQDPSCPETPQAGVGGQSTDLSSWIRSLKGLVTSNPRLAEDGGLHGVELDVSIAPGWTASCPFANGTPTVPLFVGQNASLRWVAAGSERLRLSLLDAPGGGTVVVDIDAFDGSLMDALVSQATPIIQTFSFARS